MPRQFPRPCMEYSACGVIVPAGQGNRCPTHARALQQRIDARRGSSTQRGYDSAWRRLSQQCVAEQPWCSYCGGAATDDDPLTGDHIIPRSQGGQNIAENVLVAHRSCNSRRRTKPLLPPAPRMDTPDA